MSENNDNMELFAGGDEFETPGHAWRTLKRLWRSVSNQYKRLIIVLVSVIFYTLLSIIAPLYSAHIVDLLWNSVKEAVSGGAAFHITWADGGRDIFFLLLIYLATALFYTLQSFLMSSFAETLSLRLRTEISQKLNRLPLSYFDRTKTGAVLSRAVNDLDKTAEALQTGMLKLFTAAGMVTGSLIMMFRFSALLTLIFIHGNRPRSDQSDLCQNIEMRRETAAVCEQRHLSCGRGIQRPGNYQSVSAGRKQL